MGVVEKFLGGRVEPSDKFPELSELISRIQATCTPIDIILYGSRARGEATSTSDWDLKVVVPDSAPEHIFAPLFGWTVQEGSGVYADVSFVRLSEFKDDLAAANSAASHIVEDGVVLDVR